MKYNTKRWDHVAELLEFFRVFTKDERYEECKAKIIERSRKGEVIMCSVVDTFVEMGIQEGIEKGMAEGLAEGRYRSLQSLIQKTPIALPEAMDALDFSKEERKGYKKWLKASKGRSSKKKVKVR